MESTINERISRICDNFFLAMFRQWRGLSV